MSWKTIVVLPDGERGTNACRYATADEAEQAGNELLSRWFVPKYHEVEESDEPVNYRFVNGRNERIVDPALPTSDG